MESSIFWTRFRHRNKNSNSLIIKKEKGGVLTTDLPINDYDKCSNIYQLQP